MRKFHGTEGLHCSSNARFRPVARGEALQGKVDHLVDQVSIDAEQSRAVFLHVHHVAVPSLSQSVLAIPDVLPPRARPSITICLCNTSNSANSRASRN